jgi:hypothetical protein
MRVVPGLEKDGQVTVYIETADGREIEELDSGMGGTSAATTPEEILNRFRVVGDAITNVCGTIYDRVQFALESGVKIPNEFTVEFAIKLAGKAGIPLVTEGSAEGTFKVTAKWSNSK